MNQATQASNSQAAPFDFNPFPRLDQEWTLKVTLAGMDPNDTSIQEEWILPPLPLNSMLNSSLQPNLHRSQTPPLMENETTPKKSAQDVFSKQESEALPPQPTKDPTPQEPNNHVTFYQSLAALLPDEELLRRAILRIGLQVPTDKRFVMIDDATPKMTYKEIINSRMELLKSYMKHSKEPWESKLCTWMNEMLALEQTVQVEDNLQPERKTTTLTQLREEGMSAAWIIIDHFLELSMTVHGDHPYALTVLRMMPEILNSKFSNNFLGNGDSRD